MCLMGMGILLLLQQQMEKHIKNINKMEIALGQSVILASGYGMKDTPEDLRKKYTSNKTSHLAGERMSVELEKYFHLVNSDFLYADTYFQKDYIFDWLKEDKPILICVWDKPNSKWTTSSHYMLLLATDNISKVYVSNPNGEFGGTKMSRLV